MAGTAQNNSTLELNSGFLQLDSMASMQRVGDSALTAFAAGGSTLLDLEAMSEQAAKKAAQDVRDDLAHGHHESERYRVMTEIARGGMGAVLEVHDSDLDRRVAMKVLLRDNRGKGSDSGSEGKSTNGPVERFIAEAQLTGSLEHPNIVPVHELGLDNQGRVYFTMKRVRGKSLRGVLDKLRQGHEATLAEFSQARLLNTLLKVCDAIAFAHSRGIIHRDLKPENIMVGEFGEVLVMDWGLAKQVSAKDESAFKLGVSLGSTDEDSTRTREGTVSGTPAYMAPEQARGQIEQIDERTDVFCLGAMLYELLCLLPPFIASSMTTALDMAREHKLLTPAQKLNEVLADKDLKRAFSPAGLARSKTYPRELVAVAMKAMSEKRDRRYASVREFKREIENFQSALPVSAYQDRVPARVAKWVRRNPTRAAVWTLVTIVFLLGLGVTAAVQARLSMEQASSQQRELELSQDRAAQNERALKAEQKLRAEADKSARLEKEKADAERREAEKMAARRAALGPYSKAADLRTRSATNANYALRAESWKRAAEAYNEALKVDPTFAQAHLELGQVYADLGFDEEALPHFAEADRLTAQETGRGHVEALMAYAMYDLQHKVLSASLGSNLDEIFYRFGPVKEAAEPGSMYAKLAQLLVDVAEAYRNSDAIGFLRELDMFGNELQKLESENKGPALWEIYALLAMYDYSGGTKGRGAPKAIAKHNRAYLEKARELKPNLPLLAWLDSKYADDAQDGKVSKIDPWNTYCDQFSYDPRGFYARAQLLSTQRGQNSDEALTDLRRAIERYPSYSDAHKLLLAIALRDGNITQAGDHIREMRRAQEGLSQFQVNLMEVDLTCSIGDFERMEAVIAGMFSESAPQGVKALDHAARILIRDNDFRELANLCNKLLALPHPPATARLLKARALTMSANFGDAQTLFDELKQDPSGLSEDWRAALNSWADDARRFPSLMNITAKPDVRDRFDIARIMAATGVKPDIWLNLFQVGPSVAVRMERIGKYIVAGDYVLQAIGCAKMTERQEGLSSRTNRAKAIQHLIDAFESGYLNRARILKDPLLAPLTKDPRVAKYFITR